MNDYKVPNMNEGLNLMESTGSQDNRMLRILQNLNTPMNESVETEDKKTTTCPMCGMTWTPDVTMEDGSEQVCPGCGHICSTNSNLNDAQVEDEATISESENCDDKSDEDQEDLEESLKQYVNCLDAGDVSGAKAILESADATAICESDGILLEKFVIKVNAEGQKIKKKVRTKKMKRTPAQKAALRKARKTANKGAAKKKRKKAMKARARMGLTESLRKTRTINAVQKLAESAGFNLDTKALEKAINEAYDLHEAEIMNDDDNVLSTLENILRNHGIEIKNSESELVDGVIVAHLQVSDTDAEIYLGDIADEVAESLNQYDVDYDDPEDDEDGDIFIDFYFVPILTSESCGNAKKNESEEEDCEDCDTEKDDSEDKKDPEDDEDKKINESMQMFAGGTSNVRCKLNPAFIKPGQIIFDADEQTVFTALTESVAHNGGFSLAVEVQNSKNPDLAALVSGAEINLDAAGRYFLLKNSPVK